MSKKWFGFEPTPVRELTKLEEKLGKFQGSCEFGDFPQFKGRGSGKLSLPFKSVVKFCPDAFEDDAQETSDCTSHGTRNAADISRAVEIDIKGESEAWIARGATEVIYKYRGHNGEGMNPGLATEFVTKYGLLLRQKYPFADLTKYNPKYAIRSGLTEPVKAEAAKHPCKYFLRLRTVEQARDALAAGFGLHGGSNYGNDGTRDAKGIATWNDSWNHDMAWGAADESTDLFFLVLQSWGRWNRGGHPAWGPIPGGSFLIPSTDASRMIKNGEFWAIGNVQGWPLQDLPDYGSSAFL
jgi:hypothetical protein